MDWLRAGLVPNVTRSPSLPRPAVFRRHWAVARFLGVEPGRFSSRLRPVDLCLGRGRSVSDVPFLPSAMAQAPLRGLGDGLWLISVVGTAALAARRGV